MAVQELDNRTLKPALTAAQNILNKAILRELL